jgi:hypothetical protein
MGVDVYMGEVGAGRRGVGSGACNYVMMGEVGEKGWGIIV